MTNPLYDNTKTMFKDWPVDMQNEFFQATAVRGEGWMRCHKMTDTIALLAIVTVIMLLASGITVLALSALQKLWDRRKRK